jgi:hypothetical protein
MDRPEIVLLGGPNSGKTHFAGQLYGRLRRRNCELHLRPGGTPGDLSALEDVLNSLEEGHAAQHTQADTWAEITLPVVDAHGVASEVRWPDYGGEQLLSVFDKRALTEAWQTRLKSAAGWIVLIRLGSETTYSDAMEQLSAPAGADRPVGARATRWDANAQWVELLQILLHAGGNGTVLRINEPKLAIMLSCYDELGVKSPTPSMLLRERLPLVASFVENVWQPESVSVWGLSALGQRLDENSRDEDFIDKGPEAHGWVVPPEGGQHDPDLTKPLSWLLQAI